MTSSKVHNEITRIKNQLIRLYRPERIILFGSAISGEFTKDSDLDFLIIKRDVPYRGIDRIYEVDKLIDRRGIAIDVLVYKPGEIQKAIDAGDPFIIGIVNSGKLIYGG